MTEKTQDVEVLDPSVVDFDLDAELAEVPEAPPFTFRLGGLEWTVTAPTVQTTMEAEEAPTVREFFRAVMGVELWRRFEPVFLKVDKPQATWQLARAMSKAFRLDPQSFQDDLDTTERAQMSRADYRAAGGRGPRRANGSRRR